MSWAPCKLICRNEENHEDVQEAENIESSVSGDFAHHSLNKKTTHEKNIIANAYFLNTVLRTLKHQRV
jgi:hypothetical protein